MIFSLYEQKEERIIVLQGKLHKYSQFNPKQNTAKRLGSVVYGHYSMSLKNTPLE